MSGMYKMEPAYACCIATFHFSSSNKVQYRMLAAEGSGTAMYRICYPRYTRGTPGDCYDHSNSFIFYNWNQRRIWWKSIRLAPRGDNK